ncbi:MAG: hypothetical protein ABJO94_04440, partial [Ekhidna sp.]
MPIQNKTGYYTFFLVFFLALLSISNWIERHETMPLLFAYSSAFISYVFILLRPKNSNLLLASGVI